MRLILFANVLFTIGCYSEEWRAKCDPRVIDRAWNRDMFFLLRLAFWIGLVLVLLPRDHTPSEPAAPQVGASDAMSAAGAAIHDMSQFCMRQPAACEIGGKAAIEVGNRAQGGAKKIYQMITDKKDTTGSIMPAGGDDDAALPPARIETLTPEDLQIEWSLAPRTTGAN